MDFYAVHPYLSSNSLSREMHFAIMQDQTIITNFLASDLLYGKISNVREQREAVTKDFTHKLSKITFTIKRQDRYSLEGLNEVDY